MTIKKQIDNLIDWYQRHAPGKVNTVVCDCSASTLVKIAQKERLYVTRKDKKGVEKKYLVYGNRIYKGFTLIRKEPHTEALYKQQCDAFGEHVRELHAP